MQTFLSSNKTQRGIVWDPEDFSSNVAGRWAAFYKAMESNALFYSAITRGTTMQSPHKYASLHWLIWLTIEQRKKNKLVIIVPRKMGKTSTLRAIIEQRLRFMRNRYILYATETGSSAGNTVASIASHLNSPLQRMLLGDVNPGTNQWSPLTDRVINLYNEELGIDSFLKGIGFDQQVAGLNVGKAEVRPDFILFDDIEDPNGSASEETVAKNIKSIDETYSYALSDRANDMMVVLGTSCVRGSTIHLLSKRPDWEVIHLSSIITDEEIADQLGLHVGDSIWEDAHPIKALLKEKEDNIKARTIGSWLAQVQCEIVSIGEESFDTTSIKEHRWEDIPFDDNESEIIFTIDMAYGQKTNNDKAAFVGGLWWRGTAFYLLQEFEGKVGGDVFDIALASVKMWLDAIPGKPIRIAVESTAYDAFEKYFLGTIMKLGSNYASRIILEPVLHNNEKKLARIKGTMPLIKSGNFYASSEQTLLKGKMVDFDSNPKRKRGKDLLDAFGTQVILGQRLSDKQDMPDNNNIGRSTSFVNKFKKEQQGNAEELRGFGFKPNSNTRRSRRSRYNGI